MSTSRVWLVTGASSGFGHRMTEVALEKGDRVIATLRNPADLRDLTSNYGDDRLFVTKLDVTRAEEVAQAFAAGKARFGRIDVVFNNAGRLLVGEIEATGEDAARQIMEVNFWGATRVSREAVRFFREENPAGAGGLLLNVSADGGTASQPCVGYYDASKHALEGFTETLKMELDPDWNIKIVLLSPGVFRTPVQAKAATQPLHPAYTKHTLETRKGIEMLWDPSRPILVGDTNKVVNKFWEASLLPNPPLRLFLGQDGRERVKAKVEKLITDFESYESWSNDLNEDP
ncbi:SDR family oxidoreductase [Phanerochaete sordida]|uniref:SDR family oxidoreductase n=1 Tax=Phanerochaete sordida TaxID=48140 RepID=A0A9P3LDL6_9APHY|nr:SDR family oxidoreductase [Phanerochaete sordida]